MSGFTKGNEWSLLKSQGVYMLLMSGLEPKDVAALAETSEDDLSSRLGGLPKPVNGGSYDLQSIVGLFPDTYFVTYEMVKAAAFSSPPEFALKAEGTSGNVRVSSDDLKDYLRRVGRLYIQSGEQKKQVVSSVAERIQSPTPGQRPWGQT